MVSDRHRQGALREAIEGNGSLPDVLACRGPSPQGRARAARKLHQVSGLDRESLKICRVERTATPLADTAMSVEVRTRVANLEINPGRPPARPAMPRLRRYRV